VVVSLDVALDMSAFDHVRPFEEDGAAFVDVGAGCRLQNLLDRLHATTDQTLPTVGAIKRQTMSGAISTGTHGSGKPSLSHFVASVRLAAYDATTGKAKIFEFRDGNLLKAARCALGCMGVVLSLELQTVKTYMVEERNSTRFWLSIRNAL
jgi:L-gulono-1,4-lactone dehydrogenase